MSDPDAAADYLKRAFQAQMSGDFAAAIDLYQRSIAAFPTAEAHTFLGWTYSFQGRLEEAIAECQNAIAVDPTFGNPYNDIGAYLIEMGRLDEAIPWLERATRAPRYESPEFPRFNLGRIYWPRRCTRARSRSSARWWSCGPNTGPPSRRWRRSGAS